jgi:uncharacterized membrane protein (UPF0127 family)
MKVIGRLRNRRGDVIVLSQVRWCESFACRLRGLMFRRELATGEGLLLVEHGVSRSGTAIHMLFMAFSIGVVWLDADFRVVDTAVAKPWRPIYVPQQPARYTLEAAPSVLDRVAIGDELVFEPDDISSQ